MNSETNRLATFSNWPPEAPVNPIRIAKAGFFYTGQGTEVECFSCGGKISQWNYGDQAMLRHQRMQPNCRFVVNPELADNEPLDLDRVLPQQTATAVLNAVDVSTSPLGPTPTDEDEMYRSDALRLLSFINWRDDSVSIASLVNAGFYHAGESRLRCAWCGGELSPFRQLSILESPIDIHRRAFPRCEFVQRLQNTGRAANVAPAVSQPQTPQVESPHNPMSEGATHNALLLSSGGIQGCQTLGVVPVTGRGVQHPSLASLAGRLATFAEWPAGRPQAPQALAEAGFFFTGQDDQVCCFYCDGGLGKWEAGDEPWAEHARWFPECGFVQLVKGADFVAQHRSAPPNPTLPTERSISARQQNPRIHFPVLESQVEEHMEGNPALVALGAGLDAARVRRAIRRRLQTTGVAYTSSEALIDAVLNEQLNEESWGMAPNQRFARDILAEALQEFNPATGVITLSERDQSQSEASSRSRTPNEVGQQSSLPEMTETAHADICQIDSASDSSNVREQRESSPVKRPLSLEEENRQLKEARLCKVCMDSEVSVVFLPCGHLVSCARCGAALSSCPLCRSDVRALVRAYLA
ncbi:death-associated inhibitor of apoptosis 2-like [Choristoneura fumiferana]|uniref:death-associated inhibitor of apoptosis 2-like n=1 Tax=Choristoneura fumiferana TaxID=7141 RepID=UPI003D15DEF0